MAYTEYINTPKAVWFSSIPNNWRATKMRELFSERNTKVSDMEYPALSVGKMGVVPQLDTAVKTDDGDNRKLICKGDFAINSRSDRKGAGGMSKYDGSASLIITVLKPHHELNAAFYHYLLRSHYFSEEFYRNGKGLVSDLWTTKWDEMRNIYIPVPPREEQDQIVRYLDWQVSKINKLIAAKRKKVKLLSEYKQDIIGKAVLHGISKSREEKESEIGWIGRIPASWNILRIKNLFDMRDERNHLPLSEVNLLSLYTNLGVVQNRDIEYKSGNRARTAENYKKVEKEDIVVNIILCWMGAVGRSQYVGVASPAYDVYVPKRNVCSRYYHYLFRLPVFSGECKKAGHGIMAMRWRTYSPEFRSISVPVPDYKEQLQIADWIDTHTSGIDMIIEKLFSQISILNEMKAKLISDVVTGQIDVRGIEIPEYEYVDDVSDDSEDSESEEIIEEQED